MQLRRGAVFSWGAVLAAALGRGARRTGFTGQRRGACVAMPLLSMYINNKAGGLIYHRVRLGAPLRNQRPPSHLMPHSALAQEFGSNAGAKATNKETNDHLLLASTFNSLAVILKELSPVRRLEYAGTLALALAVAPLALALAA